MILSATVLALLWGAAAARLPTLFRDRRQRAVWGCIATLALTRTAAFPPVAGRLGMPMLPHLFGVLAGYFLLRFITLVTGTGTRRWQLGLAAGVVLALTGLAALAGGISTSADALTGRLAPAAVAYWVVLDAYLVAVLAIATVLYWTNSRVAPAGFPRLGLRTMAAGTFLIAGYATVKVALIVTHASGVVTVDFPAIEPAAAAVQASGVLLAVAGALVPATRRARSVAAAYRSLRLLRPLWTAMRDAFPEVILFSPRRAIIELAGVDDVHLRLYRRVIEIRDGMLALRPYLPAVPLPAPGPPDGAGSKRNPFASGDPAETEARAVLLALRRRTAGEPPAPTPGSWAPVGREMADEVAWLSRVSAAYRRLRTVADGPAAPLTRAGAPTPRPSGSAR